MTNQFSKIMSTMTDKELVNVVTINRDDYQPLAIETAEKEIFDRKIDIENFENFKGELSLEKTNKLQLEETILNKRIKNYIQIISFSIDLIAIIFITLISAYLLDFLTPYFDEKTIKKLLVFVVILPYFIYFIVLDLNFQKTLGKYITRTKVVNKLGDRCSLGQIAGRTVFRILPIFFIGPFRKSNLNLFNYLDSFTDTVIISDNK